jgi:hypothetical protein
MRIAAFDPGINGSAALLSHGGDFDPGTPQFVDMVDLATIPDGEKRQLDASFICDLMEKWIPDAVVIENVQPMPSIPGADGARRSMGAASSFRFGLACGMIRGVVAVYTTPVTMVHPQSWKRHFGLKGADKKPGVALIKKLYPSCEPFITLVKHHGRADAGLMAAWYAEKRGML